VVGIFDLPYLTPSPRQPTLDDYMAHMTHALNVCGEDHVGIGSDTELAPRDTSPEAMAAFRKDEDDRRKAGVAAPGEDGRPMYVIGLNKPRRSEVIADALLKGRYKTTAVEKVLERNFTDALGRIWTGAGLRMGEFYEGGEGCWLRADGHSRFCSGFAGCRDHENGRRRRGVGSAYRA